MIRPRAALLIAALGLAPGAALASEVGDAERGEAAFSKCKGCHQLGPEATNRIGPHLNTLFGRRAASLEGFRYSNAFKRAGAKGLEWHADTLDAFLENPKQLVPGTRMSYRGEADPQVRADLIAYLRRFSDSPANIPEADPTAQATDHDLDPAILALTGDPEYGEYLASECTTCHQTSGGDEGIPSITLWPEEDFVIAMHAYKQKTRTHPVMNMVAGRLGDEEIAALAAYFATLEE
ncbi:c-type cytochrome [Oceanicola sp. D3]|uniref:c-type cytochrome n=1 Tax=Oceanicola sp. D3 TaxID=2587163 RepID=UPI001123E122|nr:c-type cytochrome [Oceanicola sp. D3]QDC08501.1 c-type cytochrome [Oceanicola sp. D3]